MTDGQSASLSWNKAPIWGLRLDFYYRYTFAGLSIWGALSNERTGLSFTIAAGPSQRSHSRVRAPWDSRPYFIVSDLRLPFSSPPTTRRVTVEVFDPASTRVGLTSESESESERFSLSGKFLSFYHFERTVTKSLPSRVLVLYLSALCWIHQQYTGKQIHYPATDVNSLTE
jgi:hypothetical protein